MMTGTVKLTHVAKIVREEAVQLRAMLAHHEQANEMLEEAITGDLVEKPKSAIYHFLLQIRELLKNSTTLNETMLENIMVIVSLLQNHLPDDDTDLIDSSGGNKTVH